MIKSDYPDGTCFRKGQAVYPSDDKYCTLDWGTCSMNNPNIPPETGWSGWNCHYDMSAVGCYADLNNDTLNLINNQAGLLILL